MFVVIVPTAVRFILDRQRPVYRNVFKKHITTLLETRSNTKNIEKKNRLYFLTFGREVPKGRGKQFQKSCNH